MNLQESADGMRKFSQRVEELLHAEDPLLYKALQKLFKKAATGSSRSSHRRRSGSGPEPFHRALSNVLYSHIQRMLVGENLISHTLEGFSDCICPTMCMTHRAHSLGRPSAADEAWYWPL